MNLLRAFEDERNEKEHAEINYKELDNILKEVGKIVSEGKFAVHQHRSNLFILADHYSQIIGEHPERRVDDIRETVQYIYILLDWLLLFSSFSNELDKMEYSLSKKLFVFINKTVRLLDKFMKNEDTENDREICDQLFLHMSGKIKQRIHHLVIEKQLKYMCDVIAMLEKRNILGRIYYRSSDDDLNAYYRILKNELEEKAENDKNALTSNEREFHNLSDEYFSRQYAFPMWKTYAEYKHFLREWTKDDLISVFNVFENKLSPTSTCKYSVLSEDVKMSLHQETFFSQVKIKFPKVNRLIFVSQNIRASTLKPYETFFVFKEDILRISDIDLFNRTKIEDKFFFVYYKTIDRKPLGKDEISDLSDKLYEFIYHMTSERRAEDPVKLIKP